MAKIAQWVLRVPWQWCSVAGVFWLCVMVIWATTLLFFVCFLAGSICFARAAFLLWEQYLQQPEAILPLKHEHWLSDPPGSPADDGARRASRTACVMARDGKQASGGPQPIVLLQTYRDRGGKMHHDGA